MLTVRNLLYVRRTETGWNGFEWVGVSVENGGLVECYGPRLITVRYVIIYRESVHLRPDNKGNRGKLILKKTEK